MEWTRPRLPQPSQKHAGLLETVSRMGQRRAETDCMTSVLLVQESLVSLLNHRTQKMI